MFKFATLIFALAINCYLIMNDYTQSDDTELLALLAKDDQEAFTVLYNRYWKKLFVMAANRLPRIEDAEEVVQDIFTGLWNRRANLKVTTGFSSYLAVSVKYRMIRVLDKYYKRQQYGDDILKMNQVDDSTQQWLAFEELSGEIAKYVAQLPEKCQLVFRLSREEGYSQKQIAEVLQISEKTVEAHLGKAFKTLRSKLASFMMTLL